VSLNKKHENLEKIKNALKESEHLSESEKSQAVKHVEEWVLEDKAEGLLYEELIEIASGIKMVFSELGIK
jgi:hypothetical protein